MKLLDLVDVSLICIIISCESIDWAWNRVEEAVQMELDSEEFGFVSGLTPATHPNGSSNQLAPPRHCQLPDSPLAVVS
jgi:hypothetical protein